MFRVLQPIEPRTASEQAAYAKWLDQSNRPPDGPVRPHPRRGRRDPPPLWIVLFLPAGIIFVFMLFFADSGGARLRPGDDDGRGGGDDHLDAAPAWFLDNPYHPGVGGLAPTAMQRAISQTEQAATLVGIKIAPPCDARGLAS